VIGKSCEREMAALRSLATFRAMKTKTRPKAPDEIGSYAELQRQIHDALRAEHPEWVQPNGDCPTCESYESRLAELLGKLTASPTVSSPTEEHSAL
jgi:hypothetical protein